MSSAANRDWRDLRERLIDLGDLGGELSAGLMQGQFRFIYALVAHMADDAARLARDLEAAIAAEAWATGVQLPPLIKPPTPQPPEGS